MRKDDGYNSAVSVIRYRNRLGHLRYLKISVTTAGEKNAIRSYVIWSTFSFNGYSVTILCLYSIDLMYICSCWTFLKTFPKFPSISQQIFNENFKLTLIQRICTQFHLYPKFFSFPPPQIIILKFHPQTNL